MRSLTVLPSQTHRMMTITLPPRITWSGPPCGPASTPLSITWERRAVTRLPHPGCPRPRLRHPPPPPRRIGGRPAPAPLWHVSARRLPGFFLRCLRPQRTQLPRRPWSPSLTLPETTWAFCPASRLLLSPRRHYQLLHLCALTPLRTISPAPPSGTSPPLWCWSPG